MTLVLASVGPGLPVNLALGSAHTSANAEKETVLGERLSVPMGQVLKVCLAGICRRKGSQDFRSMRILSLIHAR